MKKTQERCFKPTLDEDQRRRCVHETNVRLRKDKKEKNLWQRRAAIKNQGTEFSPSIVEKQVFLLLEAHKAGDNKNTQSVLASICTHVRTLDKEQELHPALTSSEAARCFVALLSAEIPDIQDEAAFILVNVTATKHCHVVIESGAIKPLVTLLNNSAAPLRGQAALILGNIAGHSVMLRDELLRNPLLVSSLINNLETPMTSTLLGQCVWAVATLSREKPLPERKIVNKFIAPLANVLEYLFHEEIEKEVFSDTLWALSYLSDGDDHDIQSVIDSGVLVPLKIILDDRKDDRQLFAPAIRCLGNMVSGTKEQADQVLSIGIIARMGALLNHASVHVRRDACWMISNLAIESTTNIDKILMERKRFDIVQKLVNMAIEDTYKVRKEALWALSNIMLTTDDMVHRFMVQMDVFQPICRFLEHPSDSALLNTVLDALERVLNKEGEQRKFYSVQLEEAGVLQPITELQNHQSDAVYKKVYGLIEKYFNGVDDEELEQDQNIAPTAGILDFQPVSKKLDSDFVLQMIN